MIAFLILFFHVAVWLGTEIVILRHQLNVAPASSLETELMVAARLT